MLRNCSNRLPSRLKRFHRKQRRRQSSYGISFEKRQEFSDHKLLGYTPQDIYTVVADIDRYTEFLPWCKESKVVKRSERHCVADLAVGFPPLVEKYTSFVTFRPYSMLRSVSTNGRLFNYLETTWMFRPGSDNIPGPSTEVYMKTIFEFRSMLYVSLGSPIFSEVAKTLTKAFEGRFHQLYGPDHLYSTHTSRHKMTSPNEMT